MTPRTVVLLVGVLLLALHGAEPAASPHTAPARLPDGVVLWQAAPASAERPLFFSLLDQFAAIFMPSRQERPFERSVAFLIGVSDYRFIDPNLPFVRNDLADMRRYLVEDGGFDEVYVAVEDVVSPELIENYMMNVFPKRLGPRDRLLFYYAGHGGDSDGRTGYLQFAGARPSDFSRHVLAVQRVLEWSRVNRTAHMLFILDTCSSGLAFSERTGATEDRPRLLRTISGSGSRTVFTAGSGGERTFEVQIGRSHGNGVFTASLLRALATGRTVGDAGEFLTADQLFADIKEGVANFAARYGKSLNPRRWTIDDHDSRYTGTFVFLNPAAKLRSGPYAVDAHRLAQPQGQALADGGARTGAREDAGPIPPQTPLGAAATPEIVTPAVTGTPSSTPRNETRELVVNELGFRFALQGCSRADTDLHCELLVTNRAEDRDLDVAGARLIDSDGNERGAASFGLGSTLGTQARSFLASGVPIRLQINFDDVPRHIDRLAVLELQLRVGRAEGARFGIRGTPRPQFRSVAIVEDF